MTLDAGNPNPIAFELLIASDGVAAGMRRLGEGGETLLFVHGVGSTAAIWDRQLEGFCATYRCAAVELRGNGVANPEPAPEQITRAGFARDVLAAADALGSARFHLVGCSLGGVVAFELARCAPERLASLTILGSFAAYPNAREYTRSVIAAVQTAGSMERFAHERAAKLGLPPQRMRETLAQMACKSVASYIASTHATWEGDYRALLSHITAPTLVAYGERDTIAPKELSTEIASGIEGARLVCIENAGHVSNADEPDAFNAVLAAFLDACAR